MNIEKWIEENSRRGYVSEQALREMLITHVIVPRVPNQSVLAFGLQGYGVAEVQSDELI